MHRAASSREQCSRLVLQRWHIMHSTVQDRVSRQCNRNVFAGAMERHWSLHRYTSAGPAMLPVCQCIVNSTTHWRHYCCYMFGWLGHTNIMSQRQHIPFQYACVLVNVGHCSRKHVALITRVYHTCAANCYGEQYSNG